MFTGVECQLTRCAKMDPASNGGGQMPVVYPWMKKIHVAGAGESKSGFYYLLILNYFLGIYVLFCF